MSSVTAVMVALVLFTLAGCAATQGERLSLSVVCGNEWNKGRAGSISFEKVDGEYGERTWRKLAQGPHTASVAVTWSNGWTDVTELQFEVRPESWYWVLAYELKPGEQAEQADIRMTTFGESLGHSVLEGVVTGSAPLWFPVAAVYSGMRKISGHEAQHDRPYDGCCFVWIQERETGSVIAGAPPRAK
jgi:hypothetical protein